MELEILTVGIPASLLASEGVSLRVDVAGIAESAVTFPAVSDSFQPSAAWSRRQWVELEGTDSPCIQPIRIPPVAD